MTVICDEDVTNIWATVSQSWGEFPIFLVGRLRVVAPAPLCFVDPHDAGFSNHRQETPYFCLL